MVPLGTFVARECERLLLGIEPSFYTQQRVQNLAFAIHKCTKNIVSFSVRVGICAALFSAVMNHLPPYDTPHAAPCTKAEFGVHHRHSVGGVCEQRMVAL